jgi:hypothetical protein
MRHEITSRRPSAFSVLQRAINSKRCKAIDLDFIIRCDSCHKPLAIIEETFLPIEDKIFRCTEQIANQLSIFGYVFQPIDDRWRIKRIAPDKRDIVEISNEEMENLLMGIRDQHDKRCNNPSNMIWDKVRREDVESASLSGR